MNRYLIGAQAIGATPEEAATAAAALQRKPAPTSGDGGGILTLALAGIVAVIAWPLIKRWT